MAMAVAAVAVDVTPTLAEVASAREPMSELAGLTPVASDTELRKVEELREAALRSFGPLPDKDDVQALFRKEALLRFVRARPNVAASTAMLTESIKWHQEYDLSGSLRNCMDEAVTTAGFDRFLRFSLSQSHEGWTGVDKASVAAGKHLVTMICVADMGGLQWRKAYAAVPHFKKFGRVMDDNFPEKLHVAYVVNAPRIFSAIFKILSPFLAADTKAKVRVFGKGDDHLHGKGGMTEFIELDQIPQWLGGTSPTCAIPEPSADLN